jgi:L,D-peptidoglycan transpeptidase YkuD (ErfK/YbiS/YcfS/YnhG family)
MCVLRLQVLPFFILLWFCSSSAHARPTAACEDRGTSVVIDLDRSILWLCEEGSSQGRYRVALGQGGLDKRREGDKKTPVGTYSLGSGRASSDYYRFLSVGYPTSKQKTQGYTGSAIGIHGPKKGFERWGFLNSRVNWTHGCIAVASHQDIDEIEAWVRTLDRRVVHLVRTRE